MLLQFPNADRSFGSSSGESRPVLLLMVYDCMPVHGSIAAPGWTRVLEAAREFEVHAIVGPEAYVAIERMRAGQPLPGSIRIYSPQPDAVHRVLTRLAGGNGRHRIPYQYWQRLAYRLAVTLHRRHCFSLVHQVNLEGVDEPGYAWRLGIPFVWGPARGTERVPASFLKALAAGEQIAERLHQLGLRLALGRPRVRQAARRAAVLLASSATARLDFERLFRRPAEMLPETGIFVVDRPPLTRFRNGGALHLLWVENGAGPDTLPLLLEAVANLGHDVEYHLHVVGSAEREPGWKQMATELGVRRRVSFLGEMGAPGLAAQLEWAHLLVSTSLRGTSCVPILEALSRGVPVMCFDLHAAGDVVTEACGIRIPVTHPGHAIAAMASTVRALAEDKTPLLRLSAGACDRARSYLWRTNSARVLAIYRGLVLASPRASRRSGT